MSLTKMPRSSAGRTNPPLHRDPQPDRAGPSTAGKPSRRYRFDWSLFQLVMFGCGTIVVMVWMFAFGILVGRDLPLADSDDQSLRGRVVRFMGLPQKETKVAPVAVANHEDPNKLLEELDYNKALTQKSEAAGVASSSQVEVPANKKVPSKPSSTEAATQPNQKLVPKGERSIDKKEDPTPVPSPLGHEAYALLVASLRSQDNAQKLLKQLRAKGYDSRMESLDKPDSGRWYRIVVGSYKSREEAQKFAAEFNKREKSQGMVIRVTP
jgi:cell division septation protein DedD